MSSGAQTSLTPDWETEKAKQEEIAAQIESDAPVKSDPQVAGTPAEAQPEQPKVTLRTVGFASEDYPVSVAAVGADEVGGSEDGYLVFNSESDTIDVPPAVAEQVRYLDNVEVAE